MTALRLSFLAPFIIAVAGCTTGDPDAEFNDPYEATNRKIHSFNKGFDRALVRPTSTAYGVVAPQRLRTGISNLANLLDTPRFIVNDLAQGNVEDAGHNFMRMVANLVFGFGVLDPATEFGLESRRTGFGETLYVWGASEGAYVEMPVLGPSNQRDAVGQVVDFVTNPISGVIDSSDEWVPPAANVADRLGQRYEFGATIDALLYDSADSYAQTRNLYLQNRRFELGQEDEYAFDPYEEFAE